MTTRDPDDKERTSLHEAGHAVVAWSYGVGIGSIRLDTKMKGVRRTSQLPILTFAANRTPLEQSTFYVAGHTRVTSATNAASQPWTEVWSMEACGTLVDINVTFSPSPKGGIDCSIALPPSPRR